MKQKILLVNKFYYNRGGDCIQTINLRKILEENGHEVAVFSMQFSQNIPSGYDNYYPSEVSFSGGIKNKLKAAARIFGIGDVKKQFLKLLKDFNPDVVHLHNIHSYISPVVAKLAKRHGCKVIWTMHDYKLACPSYSCLYNGKPCELCLTDKMGVLKTRCMKGSLVASILAYLEARYWNLKKLIKYTDTFICPSEFMGQMMIKAGIPKSKIVVKSNPILEQKDTSVVKENISDYYCYVGRLSQEKGVETLLKAASELPYKLKIAGSGPLEEEFRNRYSSDKIEFLGQISREEVVTLLSKAMFSVIPSEWYENNPGSVIESLCMGTPVIGAKIGGIPELISEDNGLLYEAFNKESLSNAISVMAIKYLEYNREAMTKKANMRFVAQNYYNEIKLIYSA